MTQAAPWKLILLGFLLMFVSFLIIFGMVLHLITPTFLLSFLAYGVSFSGLIIAMAGVVNLGQRRRE
ncbi:MAG: hypothetical protein R3C14_50125 [Caldilineaceae bacterium]